LAPATGVSTRLSYAMEKFNSLIHDRPELEASPDIPPDAPEAPPTSVPSAANPTPLLSDPKLLKALADLKPESIARLPELMGRHDPPDEPPIESNQPSAEEVRDPDQPPPGTETITGPTADQITLPRPSDWRFGLNRDLGLPEVNPHGADSGAAEAGYTRNCWPVSQQMFDLLRTGTAHTAEPTLGRVTVFPDQIALALGTNLQDMSNLEDVGRVMEAMPKSSVGYLITSANEGTRGHATIVATVSDFDGTKAVIDIDAGGYERDSLASVYSRVIGATHLSMYEPENIWLIAVAPDAG
jgi:hypothetical protein